MKSNPSILRIKDIIFTDSAQPPRSQGAVDKSDEVRWTLTKATYRQIKMPSDARSSDPGHPPSHAGGGTTPVQTNDVKTHFEQW